MSTKKNAAPAVNVEDQVGDEEVLDKDAIRLLILSALEEHDAKTRAELLNEIHQTIEELTGQVVSPENLNKISAMLNAALLGQAEEWKKELRAEFQAEMEQQRWSTGKKVLVVLGVTVPVAALCWWGGRRSGYKTARLEMGK